jgi:hypothetical protein
MTDDEGMPNDKIRTTGVWRTHFVIRVPPAARGSEKRRRVIFSPSALTSRTVSGSIEHVKWLALFAVMTLQCSCTTPANRRDLYSPQPDPDLDWHRQVPTTSYREEPVNR